MLAVVLPVVAMLLVMAQPVGCGSLRQPLTVSVQCVCLCCHSARIRCLHLHSACIACIRCWSTGASGTSGQHMVLCAEAFQLRPGSITYLHTWWNAPCSVEASPLRPGSKSSYNEPWWNNESMIVLAASWHLIKLEAS